MSAKASATKNLPIIISLVEDADACLMKEFVMRNIYIVLAGLITAAAVLGWSGQAVQTEPVAPAVEEKAPKADVEDVQHKLTVSALSKEDTALRAAIDTATNDSRFKSGVKPTVPSNFRLLGPDVSPALDASSNIIKMPDYKAVLDMLLENAQLASRSVALVNLEKGEILASKDSSWLLPVMKTLNDSAGEKLEVSNGTLGRLAWKCLEESREHCVCGFSPIKAAIKNACEVAKTTFVNFDGNAVNSVALFGAENCALDAVYNDIAKAVAAVPDSKGKVNVAGVSYQFERSKLDNGIELVSVLELVPEVPADQTKAEIKSAGVMGYSYQTLGIAAGAGIVMILLGFFCTRRREKDKKQLPETGEKDGRAQVGENDEKIKALKSENERLKSEVEDLKKKSADKSAELTQPKTETQDLKAAQSSEIETEAHEVEKDEASDESKAHTLVDSPANIAAMQDPLEKVLDETRLADEKMPETEEAEKSVGEAGKSADEDKCEKVEDGDKTDLAHDAEHENESADQKDSKLSGRPVLPKLGMLKASTAPKTEKMGLPKSGALTKSASAKTVKADAKSNAKDDAKDDAKSNVKDEAKSSAKNSGAKNTQEISDPNRITAQIDASINPVSSKEQSQAFFESFSDEGWDEISESFDELFNNGSVFKENKAKKREKKKSDLKGEALTGERSGTRDASLGMSGFLEAVKPPEETGRKTASTMIVKKLGTDSQDSGIKSVVRGIGDSGRPRLPTIKSAGPSLHTKTLLGAGAGIASASITDKPRATLSGIGAISKATIEDVPEMPKRDSLQMITPWREDVDKKSSGMDQNSLLDALKRRAKDVSEIEATSADGSLEYNRGLSRSGVFSVTGSRVDIDPLSDSEYFKSLYTEFTEAQKKCGDKNEITLEQFVSKLARQKETIMKKHKCKSVRFKVYEKDGKVCMTAITQK